MTTHLPDDRIPGRTTPLQNLNRTKGSLSALQAERGSNGFREGANTTRADAVAAFLFVFPDDARGTVSLGKAEEKLGQRRFAPSVVSIHNRAATRRKIVEAKSPG